jgi:hypothetical protein
MSALSARVYGGGKKLMVVKEREEKVDEREDRVRMRGYR